MATPHWNPPWHRFKDLFDQHYLTTNCQITAGHLRDAIATNTNLTRRGLAALPRPYRLYGHEPRPGEDAVAWEQGYERLRTTHPALSGYPPFAAVVAEISDVVGQLRTAPDSAVWDATDRQWAEPRTGYDRQSRPPAPRPRRRPMAAQLTPAGDPATARFDPGRRSR